MLSVVVSSSPSLVLDNDTIIASGTNSKVTIPSAYATYTGNWKIRFLSGGTLTFQELRSAANGIDVSINFNELGKMCGDVKKEDYDILINEKNCNLTPVPNGVGQMTVIELIEQTIEIAEKNI